MKNCLLLLPLGCLAALAAAPAAAQAAHAGEEALVLRQYRPSHVYTEDLYETLARLHGREIELEERVVPNLLVLGDALVIYDTAQRAEELLAAAELLDRDAGGLVEGHEAGAEDQGPETIAAAELSLFTYQPQRLDPESLAQTVGEVYGREYLFEDRYLSNLRVVDSMILVSDREERCGAIRAMLEMLDQGAESRAGPLPEVLEYQPKWVPLDGLTRALSAFQVPGSFGSGLMVSALPERGVLIVRGEPRLVEQVRGVLASLDQPAPQAMLTCYVIRGSSEAPAQAAPELLRTHLRRLLPYDHYGLEALGMLRASVVSGQTLSLQLNQPAPAGNVPPPASFTLFLRVGAYEAENGSLSLGECRFQSTTYQNSTTMFNTSTTVYGGEYAVLGVSGGEPLFVVLRVDPVGQAQ